MNKKVRGLEKIRSSKSCAHKDKLSYKSGGSCRKYASGGIAKTHKPSMQRRGK